MKKKKKTHKRQWDEEGVHALLRVISGLAHGLLRFTQQTPQYSASCFKMRVLLCSLSILSLICVCYTPNVYADEVGDAMDTREKMAIEK